MKFLCLFNRCKALDSIPITADRRKGDGGQERMRQRRKVCHICAESGNTGQHSFKNSNRIYLFGEGMNGCTKAKCSSKMPIEDGSRSRQTERRKQGGSEHLRF